MGISYTYAFRSDDIRNLGRLFDTTASEIQTSLKKLPKYTPLDDFPYSEPSSPTVPAPVFLIDSLTRQAVAATAEGPVTCYQCGATIKAYKSHFSPF
jgi:hypothetical protein